MEGKEEEETSCLSYQELRSISVISLLMENHPLKSGFSELGSFLLQVLMLY